MKVKGDLLTFGASPLWSGTAFSSFLSLQHTGKPWDVTPGCTPVSLRLFFNFKHIKSGPLSFEVHAWQI